MLYIFARDMAPAFLHRPRSPACYSYRFRGALILYWFRIANDMATITVRPCPLHERWFIAPWIQASSFAAVPLPWNLTVSDFSSSTPHSFLLLVLKTETFHRIHPLICQFFVCSERGFHFFMSFSPYHSLVPCYSGFGSIACFSP